MELKGRDRTTSQGFRVGSGTADLIGDIHRQQRRKVLRRAAQLTALAVALLLVGLAFKLAADRRAQANALETARGHFLRGTLVEVRKAAHTLEESLDEHPDHASTLAALALARAQLAVEFAEADDPESVLARLDDPSAHHDAVLAQGMTAFDQGHYDQAKEAVAEAEASDDDRIAPEHELWLRGMIVLAKVSDDPAPLKAAQAQVDEALEAEPGAVAYRRLKAALLLQAGEGEAALAELDRAREQSRTHMGLAADEALYNAYLRQELSGVADVADQLLAADENAIGNRDRAHALLARGVVHVHTGELERGIERIEAAWNQLPMWDRLPRELALQTVLQAGEAERVAQWTEATELPAEESGIYQAWGKLARGDSMGALAQLAELPQEHPRVAYLQALALVEQRRFAEALSWLERAEALLPGRVEIDVARARAHLREGDKAAAARKLEILAEEEPHAPRAWTGLGEAHLLQDEGDLEQAQRALNKAIEREPVPAEALLLLARVRTREHPREPEAERKALELLERAAEVNPHLPRYRQELALFLADLGQPERARPLLEDLADEPGTAPRALLRLVELALDEDSGEQPGRQQLEQWIAKAEQSGASSPALVRARARVELALGDETGLQEARESLGEQLEEHPEDVEARLLLTRVTWRQGDRDDAETTLRRGLQVVPEPRQDRLYLQWARFESRTGKRARAAAHAGLAWRRMRRQDRSASQLLEAADLATSLWIRQDNPRAALVIGRQVAERLPHHSRAWTIRAATELAANRSGEARTAIERAIELDDDNPRAHQLHGHTLLRFGYKDRAREAYQRAVKLAEGTPEQREYRESLRRL